MSGGLTVQKSVVITDDGEAQRVSQVCFKSLRWMGEWAVRRLPLIVLHKLQHLCGLGLPTTAGLNAHAQRIIGWVRIYFTFHILLSLFPDKRDLYLSSGQSRDGNTMGMGRLSYLESQSIIQTRRFRKSRNRSWLAS